MKNQIPDAFQEEFPLSLKKFWKKMISSLVGCAIVGVVLFVAGLIIEAVEQNSITFIWPIFFAVVLIMVVYLVLRAWYVKAYIRRYFYSASDNFATMKKGVFAPTEIHVQYQKIQDVYVDQDIIDRIMGLYDVHIASATVASGIEAHIDGVEEATADGLKEFFLDRISGGNGVAKKGKDTATAAPREPEEKVQPLRAEQMISSKEYPIGARWIQTQAFGAFFLALVVALWAITAVAENTVAILTIFVVVFFCQMIYKDIWKKNFHFAFLPDYIQLSTKVIGQSEQHMPYRTVQDVIVRQGIIEKMFGLATVYIQNAATMQAGRGKNVSQAIAIPGQTLDGANKIAEIIRSITLTRNSSNTGL